MNIKQTCGLDYRVKSSLMYRVFLAPTSAPPTDVAGGRYRACSMCDWYMESVGCIQGSKFTPPYKL